jgi:hypothetical protein
MTQLPRVFVGTMYTQEGDFQQSLTAILAQEDVVVSHVIISGLKEKEAHNALWNAWRHQGPHNDLFVKIDADTVLATTHTLRDFWDLFQTDPQITGAQAPLHDYFTDSLINGLNAFSTKVVFNDTKDELYCDRQVDTGHVRVVRGDELPLVLRPAGLHCHHATERQAFHYGLHRMLKGQRTNIDLVAAAWTRDRDRIRGFALLGADMAQLFVDNRRFNYQDPEFNAAFKVASLRYDELTNALSQRLP